MDAPERFEQLIAFITSQLARPVEDEQADDGSIIFTAGEPAEVIVHLTDSTVIVAAYGGVWEDDGGFSVEPLAAGELYWRNLPETALMNALAALITGAREARLATYRICAECGESRPPEYLDADEVCQACEEQNHGTIH